VANQCIIACWLIFIAYWVVSALGAKRKVRGRSWRRGAWLRLALLIGAFQLQRLPAFRQFSQNLYPEGAAAHPAIAAMGVILCAVGIAFAIWARRHLGRNWGMPMSLQQGHELVTTGPYAQVRHPIYTGILLAMLGSALAEGAGWFPPFLIFFAYFVYSAKTEEKLMIEQFPNEYPAYQARTKMLIPFVW
jgi:protein-S-isoprenylcysteine O-methyltransferase Ste14